MDLLGFIVGVAAAHGSSTQRAIKRALEEQTLRQKEIDDQRAQDARYWEARRTYREPQHKPLPFLPIGEDGGIASGEGWESL